MPRAALLGEWIESVLWVAERIRSLESLDWATGPNGSRNHKKLTAPCCGGSRFLEHAVSGSRSKVGENRLDPGFFDILPAVRMSSTPCKMTLFVLGITGNFLVITRDRWGFSNAVDGACLQAD